MTDKLIMTTEQREQIIARLTYGGINQESIAMLQSLTMVDSEPVAWTWDTMGSGGMSGYRMAHFQMNKPEKTATMFDLTPLYKSPQALTDDGSDWFYQLQFICRVLEGVDPAKQDKATALGMARSLKQTRWTAEKALAPITTDDVTPNMEIAFHESCIREESDTTELIAAAVNAYLVIKNRSEAK